MANENGSCGQCPPLPSTDDPPQLLDFCHGGARASPECLGKSHINEDRWDFRPVASLIKGVVETGAMVSSCRSAERRAWSFLTALTKLKQLLDNIVWHTLNGPHAKYATGSGDARRYAPGFSPIIGFANAEKPDFQGLDSHCLPGEHFYVPGWSGSPPAGWQIDEESTMFRMVWEADLPGRDEAPEAVQLGPEHAAQAMALAAVTQPGPFGPRTIELGEYFGYFDGPRLIAMAGERMFAGRLREISGVCTHPDFQRRGLARKLMAKLIRRQMLRHEIPFLHVMRENHHARDLYERMGFRNYQEAAVRVISKL
jgi:ribosomal protein S18 acetylase RimI-like enzyme